MITNPGDDKHAQSVRQRVDRTHEGFSDHEKQNT